MLFTGSDLKRLIIPLILEQFLAVAIGFADTVMVSSVGEAAVSGISLVDAINILLINVFAALATGGAVVTSQYIGRKEPDLAGQAAKQLLYTVLAVSLGISLFSLVSRGWLLQMIFGSIEQEVMASAQIYFLISAVSYPFLSVYNGSAALLRAVGNSKASLKTSILMNAINIIGNALLIYVFDMGVAGAALATLFSRMVGAVIMLVVLRNPHPLLQIPSLHKFQWNNDMVRRILRVGVPTGLENGMFQLGKLLIQSLVASLGTIAIAANAVANTLSSMQSIPGSAISLSMVAVVGRCIGAREYKQAKHYVLFLMRLTYLTVGALVGVILLLNPLILKAFHLSPETTSLAQQLVVIHGIFCIFFWPVSFTLPNALRASGDAKFTMLVSGLSMLTFRIVFSYILVNQLHMGILGIWIAMFIDWVFRSIAFVYRYYSGKWLQKAIL